MKYISTRGGIEPIDFRKAVMMGLASDGGLLLPEKIPALSRETLKSWQKLSYQDLAFRILSLYADDLPSNVLRDLIDFSYASFSHAEITPVIRKGEVFLLELFHGPTLAFKDLALQFLGNLFEYLLRQRNQKMNILGATSGDTGSAAIYGVKGRANIHIFILHPHQKVSRIQELQMTTVPDANVFNIAIQGTFDDAQLLVKAIFNDLPFKERYALGAVNSINWARILAQVVYYFYGYFRVAEERGEGEILVAVPTGNFGDIFAGFLAKRMGLPIRRLILATNENNILTRFVQRGDYSIDKVIPTYSPSMDIQVASNFERYLYYLFRENPSSVREAMASFQKSGKLIFGKEWVAAVREDFTSASVNQEETLATIRQFYESEGYLLDPHSAVGLKAGFLCQEDHLPLLCLVTAHPGKFKDAVQAAIGVDLELPAALADLEGRPTRCAVLPAQVEAVKAYIESHAIR
ncbi:MAG: threonine synthase [candidate division NC10 bacterium]|nr:threonine synthase [candidate division NC10 bacterium]